MVILKNTKIHSVLHKKLIYLHGFSFFIRAQEAILVCLSTACSYCTTLSIQVDWTITPLIKFKISYLHIELISSESSHNTNDINFITLDHSDKMQFQLEQARLYTSLNSGP